MNKVVEDYVLLENVGKGQYGNVYRAENRKTKEIFAVKVMSIDKFMHTPKLTEFTNNQINILTRLNHPNIIRFKQILRTNNNYYLVYQFCNGGTLSDFIKSKKRLTEEEALKIFVQLRSAFQTLSKNQILHRDLKPTNILFHNGVIKIADFGFCKKMMNNQLAETMVGSPIYMAPQVLKGSVYDNRADIWSLGVILYEMIYGFCPYQQSSIVNLISLIDNTILKFPSNVQISESTRNLLIRMMTVKYRARMTAAQLISYKFDVKNGVEMEKICNGYNFNDIKILFRKWAVYLGQTIEHLVNKLQKGQKYLLMSFLVYKIIKNVYKIASKSSIYWETLKIVNTLDEWDIPLKQELDTFQILSQALRQLILANGPTLPMKLQLQTHYLDLKFYIHLLSQYLNDPEAKNRLINCLLILRHYTLVEEKKIVDLTDYVTSKKSTEDKQDICKKFAYTRT